MDSRYRFLRISSVAACLVATTSLVAQVSTGALSGIVTNSNGEPLAGVKIILKSTALFSERALATNAKGEWHAPLLPVGTYQMTANKDGYVAKTADGIRIGVGSTLRQDFTMMPTKVAQTTVEVVATVAGLDKTETKTSTNYSSEQLETLPTLADRGYRSAMMMSVGVSSETLSGAPAVRGGTVQDTQIMVNGASIKDDVNGMVGRSWYVEDNLEDVQVVLSPLHARFGRVIGGQVNMVTKSGSNDFHGSVRADIHRSSWSGSSTASPHTSDSVLDEFSKSYQVTVNGPIIKDRVWFSLASNIRPVTAFPARFDWYYSDREFAQTYLTGNPLIDAVTSTDVHTFEPSVGSQIPAGYRYSTYDANKQFTRTAKSNYIEGKVSAALNPDHRVEFTFMKAEDTMTNTDYYGDLYHTDRIAALGTSKDERQSFTFSYSGVIGLQDCIEAHVTRNMDKMTYPVGDTNYGGGKFYLYEYGAKADGQWVNVGMPWGAWSTSIPQNKNNASVNVNYKHMADFAGSHELDAGLDYFQTDYDTDAAFGSLNRMYFYGGHYINAAGEYRFPAIIFQGATANGNGFDSSYQQPMGLAPVMIQYLGQDGVVKNWDQALYVNDNWTINPHWNVMVGLRLEKQGVTDVDGKKLANTTELSPRFQVRYDINGDSRDLITFTAAKYTGNFSQAFSQFFAQNGINKSISRGFSGIPNQALPGDPSDNGLYGVRFLTFEQLTAAEHYNNVYAYSDGSKNIQVSGSLKPQAVDEFTLGFQRIYENGSNLRFTYVNRSWKRNWAIAQEYDPANMVLLEDPSHSGLPSMYSQITRVFNSDELTRKYNSLEMEFNVRTTSIWSFGGNWTISRLTGNTEGGEDMQGGTNRNNFPTPYYFQRNYLLNVMHVPADAIAPEGRLVDDMTHRARLFATAVLPIGTGGQLSMSWMLRYTSGIAFGASMPNSIGIPVDFEPRPGGIPQIPANNGVAYPEPPSQWNRINGALRPYEQNDMYSVDFKLGWKLPLGWRASLIGDITVNNLFNRDPGKPYKADFMTPGYGDASLIYVDPTTFGKEQTRGTSPGNNYWVAPRNISASLGVRF